MMLSFLVTCNWKCGFGFLFQTHPTSPRTVPTDSTPHHQTQSQSLPDRYAAPSVPTTPAMESSMLAGVGGEVHQAFYNPGPVENVRLIRNDLMCAADSVTSAMSSLVKELNSGKGLETISHINLGNSTKKLSHYVGHVIKALAVCYRYDSVCSYPSTLSMLGGNFCFLENIIISFIYNA